MKFVIVFFIVVSFFCFLGFLRTISNMAKIADEETDEQMEIQTDEETPKQEPK